MGQVTIPRRFDALNRIFLRQEATLIQPSYISDEIVWCIPWLPESLLYQQEFNFEEVTGAPGVTIVTTTTVPSGEFHFVTVCAGRHNDPVARIVQVQLEHAASGNMAALAASTVTLGAALALPTDRPFIVPAGHRVRVVSAIAAAQVLTVSIFFIRCLWGEPIPRW